MFRIVMSSIMRRRRGLNSAIGGSCLRDGLQHPHPLSQEPLNKSPQSRRASGFVQSYLKDAIRYIGPIILDLAETFKGASVAPLDIYQKAMGQLHLLGRQGLTLIALAGIDMAMWDIRAKAAGLRLVELLGGSVGPVRGYNTNGLWLIPWKN